MNNWPDKQLFAELKGVAINNEDVITDEEKKKFRNSHINTAVIINEKPYFGNSISFSGVSFFAVRNANMLLTQLRNFELNIMDFKELKESFKDKNLLFPENLFFKLELSDDGFKIIEINTKIEIRLK